MAAPTPAPDSLSAIVPGSIFQDDIPPPLSTNPDIGDSDQIPPPYIYPGGNNNGGGKNQIEVTSTIQIVLISLGIVVGALFLFGVIAAYYISHKNKRAQQEQEQGKHLSNTLELGNTQNNNNTKQKHKWWQKGPLITVGQQKSAKTNYSNGGGKTSLGKRREGVQVAAAVIGVGVRGERRAFNEKQEFTDEGPGETQDLSPNSSERADDEDTAASALSILAIPPKSDQTTQLSYHSASEDESITGVGYGISRSSTPGLDNSFSPHSNGGNRNNNGNSNNQFSSLGLSTGQGFLGGDIGGPSATNGATNPRNSFIDVAQIYAKRQSMSNPLYNGVGGEGMILPPTARMSMFGDPSRLPVIHHQQRQHVHSVPVTMDYTAGARTPPPVTDLMVAHIPPPPPLCHMLQDPFKTNNNSHSTIHLLDSQGVKKICSDSGPRAEERLVKDNNSSHPPPKDAETEYSQQTVQVVPRHQRAMSPPLSSTNRCTIVHNPWTAPLFNNTTARVHDRAEEEKISYQPPSRPTSPTSIVPEHHHQAASCRNSAVLLQGGAGRGAQNQRSIAAMSSAEYFLPLRGSTSNLAQPSATTEVGTGAVIGGKPSPPAGGSSDSGERKIDHLPWHLKRASVAIPEGTAPVRLWRDDAAAGLDRSTTTSTSTPLTSATLTCGLDTGIEAEEEKIKAVRDGAAVFEGRSVSRRPSQDGELTLKKRCSKDNDSLVPAASTYPQHQPQYQQQRLARKWPGGGQIAVVDLVSGSDQQCSEDDEDVEAVMVRLPSLRGCLLEDGDDHQQHSSRDEQMSNVINDLHHQHHHYHHEQQRPYPELLEQYQMPKVVKRVPKNSYLDDYQQQQEQKANKQRHSMMGIGGGAIGLGKKLSGKIRNSMFAPSVSSSSPLPSAMAPITDVVTNVDKQGIDGGVKDTT